jgi:hypothetical protein
MQELYCHSCMLPNMIAGIIMWLMTTCGFSWMHHQVAYRLCRETMWSQDRVLIFRARIYVYNHMEFEQILYCGQTPKWYQNERHLFCDKYIDSIYSIRTSDLSARKRVVSKMTDDLSRQLRTSHKSGFNRLAWRIQDLPHVMPTLFI